MTLPAAPYLLTLASGTVAVVGPSAIIAAPAAGYRLVIHGFTLQNETNVATTLTLGGFRFMAQNQGDAVAMNFEADAPWRLAAATALNLTLSGANTCNYNVWYAIEAVQ